MGPFKLLAALAVSLLTLLASGPSDVSADNQIQLKPGATRPGGTISVKLTAPLDPRQKVFVRLTGPSQLDDLPVDSAELSRGRFRIVLPKEMRQGRYDVEVVTEQGQAVATGGHLKILATEPPTITKITPHPTYATGGVYSFEVAGEPVEVPADSVDRRRGDRVCISGGITESGPVEMGAAGCARGTAGPPRRQCWHHRAGSRGNRGSG